MRKMGQNGASDEEIGRVSSRQKIKDVDKNTEKTGTEKRGTRLRFSKT